MSPLPFLRVSRRSNKRRLTPTRILCKIGKVAVALTLVRGARRLRERRFASNRPRHTNHDGNVSMTLAIEPTQATRDARALRLLVDRDNRVQERTIVPATRIGNAPKIPRRRRANSFATPILSLCALRRAPSRSTFFLSCDLSDRRVRRFHFSILNFAFIDLSFSTRTFARHRRLHDDLTRLLRYEPIL